VENTVISHRTYVNLGVKELYRKLTSGCGWEGWFATTARVAQRVGEPVYFRWENFGADRYCAEDHGEVLLLEEGKVFSFNWHPGEKSTEVSLRFEPLGEGCLLTVEERGHSFSNEADANVALSVATGWGEALTLLKFHTEHGLTYGTVPLRS
jgi:uncharacterized protein YndB with AHSA1/START domain